MRVVMLQRILIVCEVVLDHASDMEAFCPGTDSDLFFVSRIVEVATDQSIAPTLLLSCTYQLLLAEGTAHSLLFGQMKSP